MSPPLPPPGTDTTGPVYKDGLFSRIVAINFPSVLWPTEGVFVVGDFSGTYQYGRFKIDPTKESSLDGGWQFLGSGGFDEAGTIYAATKNDEPTFCLGGYTRLSGSAGWQACIISSRDGLSWTTTWLDTEVVQTEFDLWQTQCYAMVWHGPSKKFYAEVYSYHVHYEPSPTIPDFNYEAYARGQAILLSSSDGFSWSEVVRNLTYLAVEPSGGGQIEVIIQPSDADDLKGLITPFCSGRATDNRGTPLPDGFFGYWGDARHNVLAVPTSPPEIHYANGDILYPTDSGLNITTIKNGRTLSGTADLGFPIYGAACVGDLVVAAGGLPHFPQMAMSPDQGQTWLGVDGFSDFFCNVAIGSIAPAPLV